MSRIINVLKNCYPDKMKYADLMNIRVNYDICNRASKIKHQNRDAFKREFLQLKSVIRNYYTRDVRIMCQKKEKIAFGIANMGMLSYSVFCFLKKYVRK